MHKARYSTKVWAEGGVEKVARGGLLALGWCFWWLDAAIEPYNTNKLMEASVDSTATA